MKNINEEELAKKMATTTGETIERNSDARSVAMEAAKEMLSGSPLSITEIAYQLGFSDNHNFSRTFKRVTGQTPRDYRCKSGHATRTRFSDTGDR